MESLSKRGSSWSRVAMHLGVGLALGMGGGMLGFTAGKGPGYEEGFSAGYERGGKSGFEEGFAEASLSSSAVAGATAVYLSGLLREDQTLEALAFLEGSIDDSLILYSEFSSRALPPHGKLDLRAQSSRSMKRVAEYRATYPAVSEYPLLREAIDATLASLAQGTN